MATEIVDIATAVAVVTVMIIKYSRPQISTTMQQTNASTLYISHQRTNKSNALPGDFENMISKVLAVPCLNDTRYVYNHLRLAAATRL